MKKTIAVALVILALATFLVTLTACEFDTSPEEMLRKCNQYLDPITATDGTKISIKAGVYSVGVTSISGDKITVQYAQANGANVAYTSDADGVRITQTETMELTGKNLYLVVGIPRAWENCVVNIEVGVGNLTVDDLCVHTLEVDMLTGSANIEVERAQLVDIDIKSGNLELDGDALEYDVDCETGTMDVDVEGSIVELSTNTGKIVFEIDNAVEIDVEAKTGTIKGKIEGIKESFSIQTEVGTGKCNLKNQLGDGVHTLEISVGTGNANIRFDR